MMLVCVHILVYMIVSVCVCKYAWQEKRKEKQSDTERVCMCVHGGRQGADKVEVKKISSFLPACEYIHPCNYPLIYTR